MSNRLALELVADANPFLKTLNEAAIPLNKRGAQFMRDALGGAGGGGPYTTIVELDGRPIAKSVAEHMPSIWRLRGMTA